MKERATQVIIYKCDLCGKVRDCSSRQIEQKEYDICADCWDELTSKLKGKGRLKAEPRPVRTSPPTILPELPQEKKQSFPGQPPEIIGGSTTVI